MVTCCAAYNNIDEDVARIKYLHTCGVLTHYKKKIKIKFKPVYVRL